MSFFSRSIQSRFYAVFSNKRMRRIIHNIIYSVFAFGIAEILTASRTMPIFVITVFRTSRRHGNMMFGIGQSMRDFFDDNVFVRYFRFAVRIRKEFIAMITRPIRRIPVFGARSIFCLMKIKLCSCVFCRMPLSQSSRTA